KFTWFAITPQGMWDPLDDINYLANSPHRIRVLTHLAEAPATRRDLQTHTEFSRATLSRILAEFRERGWIVEDGQTYELTPFGRELADRFSDLMELVETHQKLRQIGEWLPLDRMDVDLDRFGDATATVPTPSDPIGPMRRATELTTEAYHYRALSSGLAPTILQANWEATVRGDQTVEAVRTRDQFEAIREDSQYRTWIRETLESGCAELYSYDGTHPYNLAILDESTVFLGVVDDDGQLLALLETDDEAVLAWANDTIDAYRDESEPLTPDDFEE
ncbi:MAG: hypothetical protein R3324_20410, partial [Halobacteriales archaeon]|nr:hypothetical protein [Halobacteriales archaeon]